MILIRNIWEDLKPFAVLMAKAVLIMLMIFTDKLLHAIGRFHGVAKFVMYHYSPQRVPLEISF